MLDFIVSNFKKFMDEQGEIIIILCWMWQPHGRTQIVGVGLGFRDYVTQQTHQCNRPLRICYDSFLDEVQLR
jgi:hypothetical protein